MSEEQLTEMDYRMVWHCIHKYGFDVTEDNFQTGCIGLIKACRAFDKAKGYTFSTFAYRCIYNEIYCSHRGKRVTHVLLDDIAWRMLYEKSCVCMDGAFELSNMLKAVLNSFLLDKAQQQLFYEFYIKRAEGEPSTYEELARACHITTYKVNHIIKAVKLAFLNLYDIA